MSKTQRFFLALASAALSLALVAPAADAAEKKGFDRSNTQRNQLILRVAPEASAALTAQYDLKVLDELDQGNNRLLLVEAPRTLGAGFAGLLSLDASVRGVEPVQLAALPVGGKGTYALPNSTEVITDLGRSGGFFGRCAVHFPTLPWSGYADQGAAQLLRLEAAQLASRDCGAATVAIIDTGVDPNHELLRSALVPGYDFLGARTGIPSEWEQLDPVVREALQHSVSAILEASHDAVLNGEGSLMLLNSSMAPVAASSSHGEITGDLVPRYFGHGTMVAGIVRLTAPAARLMPLRVFNEDGSAHLFDVIRAVYYAVDHGADVINMSFSLPEHSQELKRAIRYARRHGVVCVAAAGNQAKNVLVYPAAFPDTVGVASTDLHDRLSKFSNYGAALAALAAPGDGVISTYPGGLFAAAWGTSFSTPFVAGAVALIRSSEPTADGTAWHRLIDELTSSSRPLVHLQGLVDRGRLDPLATVEAAQ